MILDDDKTITQSIDLLVVTRRCIQAFIDSYEHNDAELRIDQYHYAMGRVRNFWKRRSYKLRRMLKSFGCHVSISYDYARLAEDYIYYRFFYQSHFLFGLKLILWGKDINSGTYDEMCYEVCTSTARECFKSDSGTVKYVVSGTSHDNITDAVIGH